MKIKDKKGKTHALKIGFYSACGSSGTEDNAFYDSTSLVLCPGFLAKIVAVSNGQLEFEGALNMTLSHELGHSEDYGVRPKIYHELKKCYQKAQNKISPEDISR